MKYRPQYPEKPFKNLADAGIGLTILLIGIITATYTAVLTLLLLQQTDGDDLEILAKRHKVYIDAKAKHHQRWSGKTRNWNPVQEVALNSETF